MPVAVRSSEGLGLWAEARETMNTTEDLIDALHEAMEARNAERAGREGYDGGSWGYHGHALIEARHLADERVRRVLEALIAESVRAELAARKA